VCQDPGHDLREVRPLGKDGGALDDNSAGGVRPREPGHKGLNRVVVHYAGTGLDLDFGTGILWRR
jgi:hypothetical protein